MFFLGISVNCLLCLTIMPWRNKHCLRLRPIHGSRASETRSHYAKCSAKKNNVSDITTAAIRVLMNISSFYRYAQLYAIRTVGSSSGKDVQKPHARDRIRRRDLAHRTVREQIDLVVTSDYIYTPSSGSQQRMRLTPLTRAD